MERVSALLARRSASAAPTTSTISDKTASVKLATAEAEGPRESLIDFRSAAAEEEEYIELLVLEDEDEVAPPPPPPPPPLLPPRYADLLIPLTLADNDVLFMLPPFELALEVEAIEAGFDDDDDDVLSPPPPPPLVPPLLFSSSF